MYIKNRKVLGVLSGNVMEFYDFIIYAFLTKYISQLFFPTNNEIVGLIATFAVFASGYMTRPLGSLFFGFLGDKYGRKPSLVSSILLISISTMLIGLLPTFQQVGIMAPVLLVLLRLMQGFSVSGEEGGAAVYLCESFNSKNSGFLGSLILGSAYLGVLLGSLTCLILTSTLNDENILSYGWRIPFLFSVILGFLSLYLRLGSEESPAFLKSHEQHKQENPIKIMLAKSWKQIALQIIFVSALSIPIYLYTVFMPTYLDAVLHYDTSDSLKISVLSLLFLSFGVPVFGKISDRIGHIRCFVVGCVLLILLAYPIFLLFATETLLGLFQGLVALGFCIFFIAGPIFAILIDSFPINIRFSGVSIVFNTSMALFGATAPMVALYLIQVGNSKTLPSAYLALAGLMGLLALILLQGSKRLSIAAQRENNAVA